MPPTLPPAATVDPLHAQWDKANKDFAVALDELGKRNQLLRAQGDEQPLLQKIFDRLRGIRRDAESFDRELARLREGRLDPFDPPRAMQSLSDAKSLEDDVVGALKKARHDIEKERQP